MGGNSKISHPKWALRGVAGRLLKTRQSLQV